MYLPLIARSQRDGEVGIQERERLLLVALLEIDTRIFRLDIGEARSAAGIALAGWSVGDVRGLGPMMLVELVTDRESKTPLPPADTLAVVRSAVSRSFKSRWR